MLTRPADLLHQAEMQLRQTIVSRSDAICICWFELTLSLVNKSSALAMKRRYDQDSKRIRLQAKRRRSPRDQAQGRSFHSYDPRRDTDAQTIPKNDTAYQWIPRKYQSLSAKPVRQKPNQNLILNCHRRRNERLIRSSAPPPRNLA